MNKITLSFFVPLEPLELPFFPLLWNHSSPFFCSSLCVSYDVFLSLSMYHLHIISFFSHPSSCTHIHYYFGDKKWSVACIFNVYLMCVFENKNWRMLNLNYYNLLIEISSILKLKYEFIHFFVSIVWMMDEAYYSQNGTLINICKLCWPK